MRLNRSLGVTLLGIWLAATGLASLIDLSFNGFDLLMGVLAFAAGALILLGR